MPSNRSHTETVSTWPHRALAAAGAAVRWVFYLLATLWAVGAVYVDGPLYLYRTRLAPEQALFVLPDSIRETNLLRERPRFYDVINANCTTSLLSQTLEFRNAPFDMRMLANGRLDELIYEKGGFRGNGLPFAEMRARAFINPMALAAHEDADFSKRIREGRPGFE